MLTSTLVSTTRIYEGRPPLLQAMKPRLLLPRLDEATDALLESLLSTVGAMPKHLVVGIEIEELDPSELFRFSRHPGILVVRRLTFTSPRRP